MTLEGGEPAAGAGWKPLTAEALRALRRGFPQFLGYEVLFRLVGFAVFAPVTAWLARSLIHWSGNQAISNFDLAGFFLSPQGILFITVVVSVAFTLAFFEFGGLVALSVALIRGKTIRLPQLFLFLGLSLPKLWKLAARQFFAYAACVLPGLAVAGVAYKLLLTGSDIYFYIQAKPPEYWTAVAIAGASGLVVGFFVVRRFVDWIFSLPLVLLTPLSPAEALARSAGIVAPRRRRIVGMLLRWFAVTAAAFAIAGLALAALEFVVLRLAGDRVGLVLTVTAALAILRFATATVLALMAASGLAYVVTRRFLEFEPGVALPESLSGGQRALMARAGKLLRAGWVLVLVFAAATAFVAFRILDRVDFDESVGVTAHRGSSITAPENTMAAILLAVEEGSDYVEIDVQQTRDGTVVLVHDRDLRRVFDIRKNIWEVDFDEVRDLDSGGWFSPEFNDQRLATLDQVIDAVRGKAKLNIELKFNAPGPGLAPAVVDIIRENDFFGDCILTSLDYAGLRRAADLAPEARVGAIVTSSIGDITRLDVDLLSVSANSVNRALIDRAHRAGMEVHVWTVNEVPHMNTMIGLRVDQIITDAPALLREVMHERADLSPPEMLLLRLSEIGEGWF